MVINKTEVLEMISLMMRMMMITHLYNEIERSSVHLTVHLT